MIVRKTVRNFLRHSPHPGYQDGTLTEHILRETWWFLFIPVYQRDTIERSNMS
jgi:hypothetical protein